MTLHWLSLGFVAFIFLAFAIAGVQTLVLIPRRERKQAEAHPGLLPEQVYQGFVDRTPTREGLERLYALPAVEPERRVR